MKCNASRKSQKAFDFCVTAYLGSIVTNRNTKMDSLELAYVKRAEASIAMLASGIPNTEKKAGAFVTIARRLLSAGRNEIALSALKAHATDDLVTKAIGNALDVDDLWRGPEAQALARAYLASIAEFSIFDQIKRYARTLPPNMRFAMLATGAVGNVVTEGGPKPVIDLSLNLGDVDFLKACAIVVMSRELSLATGAEGQALFERELREAITRAMNRSVLLALLDTSTTTVAAGADPLASLRAGLRAAGPSYGFVVAVSEGDAAWLATHESNRSAGVRGGEFAPGIHLVAVDGQAGMVVIPASRIALFDGGVRMASTGEATVDLRASPEAPAQLTSLFQTNAVAMLIERQWHLAADSTGVVIVEDL
ncbi:hypothetical protein [Hydrogenophaga sp.]|uniref:hypothetical protein n=1 Tax=Hydrogenophaga sp. TaxID=1904254 RepID=UPI003F6F1BF2